MRVQELGEHGGLPEWSRFIQDHPQSTCYHDPAWKDVAERAYRYPTRFLLARDEDGGRVRGVLPLFLVDGLLRPHLSNGLFGAYAAPLADSPEAQRALVDRALELVHERELPYLVLKTLGPCASAEEGGFERIDQWVIATLSLAPDPDRVWSGLRDKIRNCVRKAQRHGLEARAGRGQLDAFYEVLAENMHQKGAPIYGHGFMRTLVNAFGDRADVITLWQGEAPIAGALTLRHRDTLAVPFASSLPSALPMSPNNLLYWEIMRRACLAGVRTLDFGRSIRGSGPLAFKLGWGAEVHPQPCYVHTPRPNTPAFQPDPQQKGVQFFVNQWKRLPRPVAKALGPVLCRQIAGLM